MSAAIQPTTVERVFDSAKHSMSPDVARWLVDLRADDELQARFDELADRNTEGTITSEELQEYDDYLQVSSLLAVLQARARDILARSNGH